MEDTPCGGFLKTASGEDSPFDWLPRDRHDLLWPPYFMAGFLRFEDAVLKMSISFGVYTELSSNLAFFGVLYADSLPFRLDRRRGDDLSWCSLRAAETLSRTGAKPSSSVMLRVGRILAFPFTLKYVGLISPRPASSSSEL